jgi:uncharacterized membrane protein YkoI
MKQPILTVMIFILFASFSSLSYANTPSTPRLFSSYIQLAQNNQSLDAAVQSIKQQTGGRILSAKTVNKNGARVYKIKVLLPSGKVQTFTVSAQ